MLCPVCIHPVLAPWRRSPREVFSVHVFRVSMFEMHTQFHSILTGLGPSWISHWWHTESFLLISIKHTHLPIDSRSFHWFVLTHGDKMPTSLLTKNNSNILYIIWVNNSLKTNAYSMRIIIFSVFSSTSPCLWAAAVSFSHCLPPPLCLTHWLSPLLPSALSSSSYVPK